MKSLDDYRIESTVMLDEPQKIGDDQKKETVKRVTSRKRRRAVEKRKTEKVNNNDINFFVAVASIVVSIVLSVFKGKLAITICLLIVILLTDLYIKIRFGKAASKVFFIVSMVLTCLLIGCIGPDDTTPKYGRLINLIIDSVSEKLTGNTDADSDEADEKLTGNTDADSDEVDDKPVENLTEEFNCYKSSEYNYKIEVPVAFCEVDDDSEEDLQLTTEDRLCSIVIKARYFQESIPEEFMIQEIECNSGWTVIYEDDQLESDGWYAINARNKEKELYRKCILSGNLIRMFTLTYPLELYKEFTKDGYDYVSHISNSFIKIE